MDNEEIQLSRMRHEEFERSRSLSAGVSAGMPAGDSAAVSTGEMVNDSRAADRDAVREAAEQRQRSLEENGGIAKHE